MKSELKWKKGIMDFWCIIFVILLVVGAKPAKSRCPRPVNILFVLESSRNVNEQTFLKAKEFIKETANIISRHTDMAVILFGFNASVAVKFGHNDTDHFKQEVNRLELSKDTPNILKAFSLVGKHWMFDTAIPYAARAVVVMTTGEDAVGEDRDFSDAVKKITESSHVFGIRLKENQYLRRFLDIASDYNLIFNLKDLLVNQQKKKNFFFQACNSLGDIRLNGSEVNKGRLEVYKNGTWLQVCSPTWNHSLTDIVCHRLGFKVTSKVGDNDILSFLKKERCSRKNTSSTRDCEEDGPSISENCNHSNVNLVCEVPVRLSHSPTGPHIGLVEVFFLGTWGSVCSDHFNFHAANIVCRNLGYQQSLKTFVDVSNRVDSLPVMHLDRAYCNQENGSLTHCELVKTDRKAATLCKIRPVSVICDNKQHGKTIIETTTESLNSKLTKSCKLSNGEGVSWHYENGLERRNILASDRRIWFTVDNMKESKLIIREINLSDAGAYFCQSGTKREMLFLYIDVNPGEEAEAKKIVYSGKDAILSCNVIGSPPPQLIWKKANKSLGLEKESLPKYVLQDNGSLLIRNVSAQDVGKYECKFSQKKDGSVVNYQRKMVQLLLYEKPQISILDNDKTVANGISVSFTCTASGIPLPNITWYRNTTAIHTGDHYQIHTSHSDGRVDSILRITNVSRPYYRKYKCKAWNEAGSVSAFALITIQPVSEHSNSPKDNTISKQTLLLVVIVFVVAVIVAASFGLVVWFVRRKKRKHSPPGRLSELRAISSDSCDIWELPKGSLHLQKMIGKGMFGEVWKAVALNKNENKYSSRSSMEQIVAVKKPKDASSGVQNEMLKQEIAVNKRLTGKKHNNIVNFLGCITTDDMVMMVIEYVPYGDLLGYLRESRGIKDKFYYHCEELPNQKEVSPYELFSFATQIACGMSFLAEKKVIHRDLAARNVLVGENLTCKITDFGLAKVMKDDYGYMGNRKGRLPIKWTAPEVFSSDINITSQSDVWSYGITLYEIFTIGGDPYPGLGEWDIVYRIKHDTYIMPKPEHVSDEIYEVMVLCWKKDPDLRPTFDELHKQLTKMVETNHYLDLDMTKYQGHIYSNLEYMDDDSLI